MPNTSNPVNRVTVIKKTDAPRLGFTLVPMKEYFKLTAFNVIIPVVISLCSLSTVAVGQTGESDRFLASYYEKLGDRFYQHRELEEHLQSSQRYYLYALKISTEPSHLYWKLSRGYWLEGEQSILSSEKKRFYQKGIDYGRKAIEAAPESSVAHLWLALSIGKYVLEEGILKSIYRKEDVKNELELALKLDGKNVDAYLGLANWYFQVPPVLGGNKQYAYQLLQKGLRLEAENTQVYLNKARFLIADGRLDEGLELLKRIIAQKQVAYRSNSIRMKIDAQALLSRYEEP
ncbi:MAG: hypothetical protein GY786_04440 [Proteobacteria bacterium]|nr:hypothetical protein [Pseudomonadota bacterium]